MENDHSEIPSTEKHDLDFEKSVSELVHAVVEGLEEQHRDDVESFEIYMHRIRAKIHSNINLFQSRFSKGYHVLMEELKKDNSEHERLP